MAWYKYNTSRSDNGETIPGVYLPAIIHNFNHYFAFLGVYQDSMIDCWGLCTFDEFVGKVRSGGVTNHVPSGKPFEIHHLIRILVDDSQSHGTRDDLIKDVRSAIDELNGRETAQNRFIFALKKYRAESTPENLVELRLEHESLPSYYYQYTFGSRFERFPEIQELLGISNQNESGQSDSS